MYIIEIIPLQKGIPKDTLSYFSMQPIALGSLVHVPLQSRTIQGIVVGQSLAKDMKASLRSGNFSLKQVSEVVSPDYFPKKILEVLTLIADRSTVPLGTLFVQLFPEPVIPFFQKWKQTEKIKNDIRIIQGSSKEQLHQYKIISKEYITKQKSIHFIASTAHEVKKIALYLSSINIAPVVSFFGGQTAKAREQSYAQLSEDLPIIICSTPQFITLPRNDVGACVIASYQSSHYIHEYITTIDYRNVIAVFSELFGYQRYISENIPIPEFNAIVQQRKGYQEKEQTKKPSSAKIIISEKEGFDRPKYVSPFFSSETIELIRKSITEKIPIFIYANKKSVSTVTTCRDCSFTVHCPNCDNFMHVIKKNPLQTADQVFYCHRCETELPPINRCPLCLGWNLIPLGATQHSLAQEIKKIFPEAILFISNQDETKTETACRKIVTDWHQAGGLLIGNTKIIPYIKTIPATIIASFEQSMSIPDYKTPMRTLSLFQELFEKTEQFFIIQTKNKSQEFLTLFKDQEMALLAHKDAILRKELLYPPYATLITITVNNIKRKDHQHARDFLRRPITDYVHSLHSEFFEKTQTYTVTAKIHITEPFWKHVNPKTKQFLVFLKTVKEYADISVESPFPFLD